MPYYKKNKPEELDKEEYNRFKEALTSSPITDSKTFQVR